MSLSRNLVCVLLLSACATGRLVAAEPATSDPPAPDAQKPSSYAPAQALVSQVQQYIESIEKTLANPANYSQYQQDRVAKDANTLAVLGLVLGMHDQENELKRAAPALIAAANELAVAASDHAQAKAALDQVKQSLTIEEKPPQLEWEPVADLAQLMKQVPIVNNNLRRGVTGRRFDRSAESSIGHAVTLAAIAQASMVDTTYCASEEDFAAWAKICVDMRDGAAAVQQAVRQGDQKAATAALDRVVETCDACHHRFRD